MKRSLFNKLKPVALAAVGVFLGRGASADTLLTFNARPPGQNNNAMIIDGFGSHATNSSAGVQVIVQDPSMPAKMWAALGDWCQSETGAIATSTDSGATWVQTGFSGLPPISRIGLGVGANPNGVTGQYENGNGNGGGDTERMRQAVQRYREVVDRLLAV